MNPTESPSEQDNGPFPGNETEWRCPHCLVESREERLFENDGAWFCPACENAYPHGDWAMLYADLVNSLLDERDSLRSGLAAAQAEIHALKSMSDGALASLRAVMDRLCTRNQTTQEKNAP